MFRIISNEEIAPQLHKMIIDAPRIAQKRKPGQFVIVRCSSGRERIPLTIADDDSLNGTITLIVQAIGISTKEIVSLKSGDSLLDVAGPLGQPTEIERLGKIVCVGGGVGTAVLFPLAKGLAEAGNELTTIIGGRNNQYVILENELKTFSKKIYITTEDGSNGEKGFVTAPLNRILNDDSQRPVAVYAVGPVPMMKAVCDLTKQYGVHTIVSLNPIMIDGTGMCGGCRVTVGGKVKFACVDGPEFNGNLVDFDELSARQTAYSELDKHGCRLDRKLSDLKRN